MKEKRIAERRRAKVRSGKTRSAHLTSMSEREIMKAAKADPDAQPTDLEFWKDARIVLPERKHPITLRVDGDVLEWFKAQGHRYQSRINAVLRSYMEARRKAG